MNQQAKELNSLIEQVSQRVVDRTINEKYLISRMAVIVNSFDEETNTASIIIPTDLSTPTQYKYPNRTGRRKLNYGDKVYLIYQTNNISQGWLEDNKGFTGGGGGYSDFKFVKGRAITLYDTDGVTPIHRLLPENILFYDGTDASTDLFNYNRLDNKPQINGHTLSGNQTDTDLGLNVTSAKVISALGYTPYSSLNPAGYTSNQGTVKNVRVRATSPVVSSQNTSQTTSLNTTISLANGYGDTKNPYESKTKNTVLASPSGSDGVPSFRSLVMADLPIKWGSYVYIDTSSPATDTFSFTDTNMIGKICIVCSTQDSNQPVKSATLTSSTGAITVTLARAVHVVRINYICF